AARDSPGPRASAPNGAAASANRATAHRSPRGRGASNLARDSACVLTEPAGAREDAARKGLRQATEEAGPPPRREAGAPRDGVGATDPCRARRTRTGVFLRSPRAG